MDLARFEFEAEADAARHLMTSLTAVLYSLESEGAKPELSSAAIFLADELQNQTATIFEAVKQLIEGNSVWEATASGDNGE